MSAKQTNNSPPQKMCKTISKAAVAAQKTTDYEVLSTNCTLIGSNNLNLATTPKINICSKPMKQHAELKKSSPRHVTNFQLMNAKGFSPISSPLSNGLYSNPSPSYPQNAVSPYNVQISSPASVSGIKSPVASPQQMRPPTPQPILPQAFQQIPVMTSGANLVQIIHNTPGYQNHPVLARQTIIGASNQSLQQPSPLIKIKPPQNILPKPPATSGAPPQPAKPPTGARPTHPQTSVVQNPQLPPNPAQIVLPNQTILPAAQPGTLLLNQMPLIVQQNTAHGGVQLILRPSTPNSSPQLTAKNLAPQNLILQQGGPAAAAPQVILQHAGAQRGAIQQPQQLVRVLTANGMIQQLAPTYITMQNQLNLQQLTQPAAMNQPTNQPSKILTQNGQHILQNHQGLIGACLQAPVNQAGAGGMGGTPAPVLGGMEQLPPPKRKPKKKKKIKEKLDLGSIMKLSGIGDEDDVMFESDNSESTNTDSNPIVTQQQQQQKTTTPPSIITSPAITSPLVSSPLITNPLVTSPSDKQQITQNLTQNLSQNLTQNLNQSLNQVLPDKQPFAQSQLSVQQSLSDINAINQNLTQIGLIQNSAQNFLNSNNQLIQSQMGNTLINQDNQGLTNFLNNLQNQNFIPGIPGIPGIQKFPQTSQQNFPNLIASNNENLKKNLVPAHFNIPNIQVQNFPNQNLILNQAPSTIIAPNFPGLLQNNLIQNAGGNLNFLPTGLAEPYGGGNMQRMGGFKLALSEDGRLILQHDPNLNQDIQSQLLLQNIFGINLQGGNLVLTSVGPSPTKTDTIQTQQTKTTNILKSVITSPRPAEVQNPTIPPPAIPQPPVTSGAPYVVNLTPDQLEQLKKNGQVSVNGQIIYMQRPAAKIEDKVPKSPKNKAKKKFPPQQINTIKSIQPNQTLINQLQSPVITQKIQEKPISRVDNQLGIPGTQLAIPINQQETSTNQQDSLKNQQNMEKNQLGIPDTHPNSETNQLGIPKPPQNAGNNQLGIPKPPQNTGNNQLGIRGTHQNIEKNQLGSRAPTSQEQDMNVEQFLSNLNINTTNLSQLISQKLSQELPNVDHKILNIQAGPNAGQLVAKIDISSSDMSQLFGNESNLQPGGSLNQPFVQVKQENEPALDTPMPALVLSSEAQNDKNTVYQRIQTIQLTPQKQQLLKSVQLQIQALTARLQQKDSKSENIPENDIQNALRHLYMEQQKILATGKLLPTINQPITSLNCNMDTMSTQSGPVVANSLKSNGSYMTSLLQQPVVSSNQPQKIYYHNGNQIITLNPSNILPNPVMTPSVTSSSTNPPQPQPPQPPTSTSTSTATQTQTLQPQNKLKKSPVPVAVSTPTVSTPTKTTVATTSDKGCQMSPNQPSQITIKTEAPTTTTTSVLTTPAAPVVATLAPKPRCAKPTYSKAQLIEQQLQTDQNGANNPDINTPFASKADACKRLVRYHCYNQPVLSEKDLNKADEIFELTARHFIGKFQGMVNKYKYLLLKESMREVPTSELMMIDRMFLAEEQQSFLKLQSDYKLQTDLEEDIPPTSTELTPIDEKPDFQLTDELIDDFVSVKQESESDKSEPAGYEGPTNTDFNIKCGLNYFADESCDSVYTSPSTKYDEFVDESPSQKPEKGGGGGAGESYNTTKIIGNFEIEINNKKNYRQKFIDNKQENRKQEENFEKSDDYDEWLCIQRELGYLTSDNQKQEAGKDLGDSSTSSEMKKADKQSAQKRNSAENRLETLKKFRVEKHNTKTKKTGSIIGEVKFEVRIEHKKVFAEQNSSKSGAPKRAHIEFQSKEVNEAAKRAKNDQTNHNLQIKQEDNYLEEHFPELLDAASSDGLIDTSIDEQVQSAIDSILNLQQIASMTDQKEGTATPQQVTCRNINTLTNYGSGQGGGAPDLVGFSEDTLDDAVKSILS